ncbi:hypothetical protein ACFVTC_20005 [Streptomyces sp. NPDC057950]|uniref:hypothetical protein n=1 Tax=Streptomyces sp. NPDC057950 TaxID=3346288 RepID=UPI0036E6427C
MGVNVLREGRTLVLDWAAGQDTALAPLLDAASWPWFTAAGKVQAAGLSDPGPDAPASWPREAAAIRERGVTLDRGEVVEGVCCAAWPSTAVRSWRGSAARRCRCWARVAAPSERRLS